MFEFYVFEWQGVVWLYDDNERTHICSSQPTIYAYPMYGQTQHDQDSLDHLEPTYFSPELVAMENPMFVLSVDEEDAEQAWEQAMEEVSANHPI